MVGPGFPPEYGPQLRKETAVFGRLGVLRVESAFRGFGEDVFGKAVPAQRLQLERERVQVGLIGEILAAHMRCGAQIHQQAVDRAQMLHFLHRHADEVVGARRAGAANRFIFLLQREAA